MGLVFAAMLPAMLLAGLGCSAGAPAPQFQPQPIRGTLAQVWTIPSGCPRTLVTPSHTKGVTFWANDTLWATYLRTRDADAQLLKRSLGGSPNATAIIGFELYLLRGIFMSTWGFWPAVFRPFRTVFPGLGAGFLNLGGKMERTAKKRGKMSKNGREMA